MSSTEFRPFPKVPRLNRQMVITEKVDGTNGVIHIWDDLSILVGSRNRWLSPEKGKDNFDFARWVEERKDALISCLGPGTHYGEYFGRNYGMLDRHFALFNTKRWSIDNTRSVPGLTVVPVLYEGLFDTQVIASVLLGLQMGGSVMVPNYRAPEGIMVYHVAAGHYFKVTVEHDEEWKGKRL